jgi:rifampicin phosphotransferase
MDNSSKIGSKAEKLLFLKKKGFNVPDLTVLSKKLSEKEVLKVCNKNQIYAVRSSCISEDSDSKSYAGYFYSEIGVSYSNIYRAYQKVVSSFKNEDGAVIIQEFIPSEKSGVIFTNDGSSNMVINSNFGVCKTVVEGWECDELLVSKNGILLKREFPKKKESLIWKGNQLIKNIENQFSINSNEIHKLIEKCKEIEIIMNAPQDIEWCFFKEKLYILQSRPITASINDLKNWVYYDSANIAESYSGLISPLTISFASHIYKEVYSQLIHKSGVSKGKLNKYKEVFNNMVNSFNGRLFYNMNNWYKMMSFIPGYNRNKENLEVMITSNVKEEVIRDIKPSIILKITYPFIVVWKFFRVKYNNKKFQKYVIAFIKNSRKKSFKTLSYNDCKTAYKEVQEKLIKKWYITVENDFLVMTYFGILKKKFSEERVNKIISFESKTTTQLNALINLSKKIINNQNILELINEMNNEKLNTYILKNDSLNKLLEDYFSVYGGRFANELKLESPDVEENIVDFFKVLKNYSSLEIKNLKKENKESYAIKKFKKYAAQREEFRLLRSNAFSIVRKIFNRIGQIYLEENKIEKQKDIFFLKINEIFLNKIDYKDLIKERKDQYEEFKNKEIPDFFGVVDGEQPKALNEQDSEKEKLGGRGCTKGEIQGRIRVFKDYYLPEKIDFEIAVAKNTDPGWTPLLGLCKGLIIENGGILSHAAIVSRELGIPTIIGVKNATKILKSGETLKINGANGNIEIIKSN